jgi:hypothetical protein
MEPHIMATQIDISPARRSQIANLGPDAEATVVDARPGTRSLLMAAKPDGETPVHNGPYLD